MKLRTQKITALMAAAVLGISAFGSVPVTAAESTETADSGAAMMVDGEAVSSDLVAGTIKPSDVTCSRSRTRALQCLQRKILKIRPMQ